jgi:hypothetical protein
MQTFENLQVDTAPKVPWNKGKLLGCKAYTHLLNKIQKNGAPSHRWSVAAK